LFADVINIEMILASIKYKKKEINNEINRKLGLAVDNR